MRKFFAILILTSILFGQVLINEIMFKPSVISQEWIELYNAGDSSVDIHSWTISDPNYTAIIVDSSFTIEPGEFIIISQFDTTFDCPTIFVESSWPYLNNTGDTVYLRDSDSALVDIAVYSVSSSWGYDISVELPEYSSDGSDPANWLQCEDATGSTPCHINSVYEITYPVDISITSITIEPSNPTPDDTFSITVIVENLGTENASGFSLTTEYISSSDTTEIETIELSDIPAGGSVEQQFSLTLPAGNYSILASVDDTLGTNNSNSIDIVVSEPGEVPDILITEIMFKPTESSEEWIELYNNDHIAVDIEGWSITDATGNAIITSESFIIEPGEYAIITEVDMTGFSCPTLTCEDWRFLNNDGESLHLHDSIGTVVDSAIFSVSDSWSYGVTVERCSLYADGWNEDNWIACQDPAGATPCQINSTWPIDYDIAITSMSAEPFRPEPDNPFNVFVDIENVGVYTASGYDISLYLDTDRSHNYTVDDTLISTQSIPDLNSDESTTISFNVSLPAGLYSLVAVLSDTVRSNNEAFITVQVGMTIVITEIMFDPEISDHEWIEVYNAGNESIDLANWDIADASGTGTITYDSFIIEPGEYAIICEVPLAGFSCPSIVAESWRYLNNTDYESIYLINPDEEIVEQVAYDVDDWTQDVSAERISIYVDGMDTDNWRPSRSIDGSTPCQDNSIWSATEKITCDVQPNPFDPERGENAEIVINAPVDATIETRIYNLRGKLIVDFEAKAANVWDGNDENGNPVPTGAYVIVAEIEQNGKVTHHRFPIAVARGMKK